MRVVIAHDFMETYGGAERVTEEMARAFPEAPVVAILGRHSVARRMGVEDRFTTLLPERPGLLRHYRPLAPLFPVLADRFRLPDADVVLSSSYAFAHRLRTRNDAARVCYCHSPLRFAWSMTESYQREWARSPMRERAFQLVARGMRRSDRRSAQGVTTYLTQSPFTAGLIERCYGRRAEVVGAPVDISVFRPSGEPPKDYFLLCGRLTEPYKQMGIVIDAFGRLPNRLLVAGTGPALADLRGRASSNVEFLGHLEDSELVGVMQDCRAAIFPSRDDFGLVPIEVMACGRPVIAFGDGGAVHTVKPGVTGELFHDQSAECVEHAVRAFRDELYDSAALVDHVKSYDRDRFNQRIRATVERIAAERAGRNGRVV